VSPYDRPVTNREQPVIIEVAINGLKSKRENPNVPGEPAEIIFDLAPTSYQFLSGHRIRITFSGADTSNSAALPGPAPTWRIYRDRLHTSSLVLPVVKDGM